MGADFGLVLHPWNSARAADDLLERAVGEVGLDHVTVPVLTGMLTQWRLHAPLESPRFHTEGGWHYPASAKAYATSGLRPHVARWVGSRDVLAPLRDRVSQLGLALLFRLDLRRAARRVGDVAQIRARDAWSAVNEEASPCVLNPVLREGLRETLADLRRYEPHGIQLADWQVDLPLAETTVQPAGSDDAVRALTELCFCPACRQIALARGADPDLAARSVQVHVQRLTREEVPDSAYTAVESDEVLGAYRSARRGDTREWLERLLPSAPGARWFLISEVGIPTISEEAPAGWRPMMAIREAAALERACTLFRGGDPVQGAPPGLSLHLGRRVFQTSQQLVSEISRWANQGVGQFDFEGVEESAPHVLRWLKQAVRFARRG